MFRKISLLVEFFFVNLRVIFAIYIDIYELNLIKRRKKIIN